LPAWKNGFTTFGVFNNHLKICDAQLAAWAQILRDVPDARLIVKFPCGHDPALRAWYRDKLTSLGVEPERIAMHEPKASFMEHLDLYNEVDLALDTFPFNGSMTTLEGLWMGVPVVSCVGETFVSRVGLSILSQLDLDVFCARSRDEYRAKAVAFAQQPEHLAVLRRSLRSTLLHSTICQPRRMATEMESAFRKMWRHYIDKDD
jgi:predicted O-linked N-acetylglucosamine transferase (SPINDLY family)